MKTYRPILITALAAISVAGFSQNMVSSQSWTVGSGSIGVFSENGSDSQNFREMGIGPMGTQTILWKAVADAANGADGGWTTNNFTIDNTKMYRFAVWIKKSNSTDGYTYLGCGTNDILDLSGSVNQNPYFWLGDLPLLDRWYLLVGYVHSSGDASTTSYGGVYDGVTGAKVLSTQDFKFSSAATTTVHRAYLYYDQTTSDRQYFYGPEVYKVDQPLTETILPSIVSGNAFFGGSVGIGTTSPGGKLQVGGSTYIGNENGDGLYRISVGASGGDYGSVGYGYKFTTSSNSYTYAVADYASQLRFDAGGFAFFTAPTGSAGGAVGFFRAMTILQSGYVGIGTPSPEQKLDVRGNLVLETGSSPVLYTGTGTSELNRYLRLINSSQLGSASGLMAGGILISDAYSYANPGKNDLIVKGSVGIGTPSPDAKLAVAGQVHAQEVKVSVTVPGPDYVFEKNYKLTSLEEIKHYIDQNKHLPEVPSAKEMEKNGVQLGEMNMLLLKKIEELTLYVIEQQKQMGKMQNEIDQLKK